MADKMIKITLRKSLIGSLPKQRATAKALGLGEISSSTVRRDDGVTRGMIRVIEHLVSVEEA